MSRYKFANSAQTIIYDLDNENKKIRITDSEWPKGDVESGLVIPCVEPHEKLSCEIIKALDYLKSTDWYVIREMSRGVSIPSDVKNKRDEAIKIADNRKK